MTQSTSHPSVAAVIEEQKTDDSEETVCVRLSERSIVATELVIDAIRRNAPSATENDCIDLIFSIGLLEFNNPGLPIDLGRAFEAMIANRQAVRMHHHQE